MSAVVTNKSEVLSMLMSSDDENERPKAAAVALKTRPAEASTAQRTVKGKRKKAEEKV
jgi:hypothetical protein